MYMYRTVLPERWTYTPGYHLITFLKYKKYLLTLFLTLYP